MKTRARALIRCAAGALVLMGACCLCAYPRDKAVDPEEPQGWPRIVRQGSVTLSLYQPQVDTWKGNRLTAYAAVAAQNGSAQAKYGVVSFTARTEVDKVGRLVTLDDFQILRAEFPTDSSNASQYQEIIQQWAAGRVRTVDLDRLEADLAVGHDDGLPKGVPLRNEPPFILFATEPAVLISIDGEPILQHVEGEAGLQRVMNTRALILRDDRAGAYYLALMGGWAAATSLDAQWEYAESVPPALNTLRDRLAESDEIDPLSGADDESVGAERLTRESMPHVFVAYEPAELLQTTSEPQFTPISGTDLLYVSNSGNDIFLNTGDQRYYVRLSGRWFRSGSIEGSWSYVEGAQLPRDFAQIPESSPMSRVLVSVPGTPAARESVIASTIPQTATVTRSDASLQVDYDGEPQFDAIEGTPLRYAANCPTPVIEVAPATYYAVYNGVWFIAGSPFGPWSAALSVPSVIYTIPPACPIYYATFVRVYGYTPEVVYCGYTPGYYSVFLSLGGTVVYGTGWHYPRFFHRHWFARPLTYGCGAGFGWSDARGWWFDFGIGYHYHSFRPWYGPLHYGWKPRPGWRPMWGRHGWGGFANVNVYGRWGSSAVSHTHASWNRQPGRPSPSYYRRPRTDARTGIITGPSRTSPVRTPRSDIPPRTIPRPQPSRPAPPVRTPTLPSRPTTPTLPRRMTTNQPVAGRDGTVYRFAPYTGWQQQGRRGWERLPANRPVRDLNRIQLGRIQGQQRFDTFRRQAAPRVNVSPQRIQPRTPQPPAGGMRPRR